jgi:sterol desaturase/sphingolipid hydroxylase (fatty acid hydroxylase superfamily)
MFDSIVDFIHQIQGKYTFDDPIAAYGVIAFVLLIGLEIGLSLKYDPELYQWRDFGASVSMGAGSVVVAVFAKIMSFAMFIGVYNIFNHPVDPTASYNYFDPNCVNIFGWASFGMAWYLFLICQVLDDFNYYWYHRLSHTVRCLWAAHIVHHSSDNFNLGSGIRNGWITLLYKPIFWLWLPAIGFSPVMVMICLSIQSLWQFQLHTKFMPYLGFFEIFMNTHKQHQVHHAQNVEYMDKNHGGYLNIFDRLFGSHEILDDHNIDIKFGVVHAPQSYNPLVILTHEYKDIWKDVKSTKNFKHKLMYIFGPPGWTPNDPTQTVRAMQREIKRRKQEAASQQHKSMVA